MSLLLKYIANPADEIIPRLWLGSRHALDPEFIKKQNINIIINMTPHVPLLDNKDVMSYRFPMLDKHSDTLRFYRHMPIILNLINRLHVSGKNILVHCQEGIQRAPTVVVCYLKKYKNMTPRLATTLTRNRRTLAFINGFTFPYIINNVF